MNVEDLGDDLTALLEENGGLGEFETDGAMASTPRWLFPRFNPVCPDCRVEYNLIDYPEGRTADEPEFICPKCETEHTMDVADKYLSRSGIGPYDTDVETIAAWLSAPRNIVGAILLLGNPGTGKTALIEAAVTHSDRTMTTVVCTPDHTKDSLFLRFVGEGKGDLIHDEDGPKSARSPYTLGPIPYAAKHGHVLYLDEFMLLVDGVKPLVYPLADGRRYLPEGNVDGSAMEVHPDFRLILSSNPMVRGASLPEPVGSRCASTTLTVETNAGLLNDLGIDESVIAAWEALGQVGAWRPEIRELRLADYWLSVDPVQSTSAFLPEHCPESQRRQVRDIVMAHLGADIREDGRLVVS